MGEQPVTDLSYLYHIAMDDHDIVIQTVEAFLEDTPSSLRQLHSTFKKQQWQQLAKTAHRIKPNLKYMGMERSLMLLKEIEGQAKAGKVQEGLESSLEELTVCCNRALQELATEVERLKNRGSV